MVTIVLAPKPQTWIKTGARFLVEHGGSTADLEVLKEAARLARDSGKCATFVRKNPAPRQDTSFSAEEVLVAMRDGIEIKPLNEFDE